MRGFGILDWLEESFISRLLRMLGPYAVLIAAFTFFLDLEDRRAQREAQAWQVIVTPAGGNSGKREALEYLNLQTAATLPNPRYYLSWLPVGQLPQPGSSIAPAVWVLDFGPWKAKATLRGVYLSQPRGGRRVYLAGADLPKAEFRYAILQGVIFNRSNLAGSDFGGAAVAGVDFQVSDLRSANFSRADFALNSSRVQGETLFKYADLAGANFSSIRGVSAAEFSKLIEDTCVDAKTRLPTGVDRPRGCKRDGSGSVIRLPSGVPERMSSR